MIKKQQIKSRHVCKVTFELPKDLEADAVHLLADFSDWQDVPFVRQPGGGWKLVQELEPGREYQFRYKVVHGDHNHYFNDEQADGTVPNDQGSSNGVLRA